MKVLKSFLKGWAEYYNIYVIYISYDIISSTNLHLYSPTALHPNTSLTTFEEDIIHPSDSD